MNKKAFLAGFSEKCAEYGVDPEKLIKQAQAPDGYIGVSHQRYLPIAKKRDLTKEEQEEIDRESKKLIPRIFTSDEDSPYVMLSSPKKSSRLAGTLMGLAAGTYGAAAGTAIGAHTDRIGRGALIGALAAGVPTGLLTAFLARKAKDAANRTIIDRVRRLPEGATLRDYKSDPVVQAEADRTAAAARTAMMASALMR